ncbi:hypothetical protein D3C71_1828170 [compost metagenome]
MTSIAVVANTATATPASRVLGNPRAVEAAGKSLRVAKAASGGSAQPRERLANTVIRATSGAPRP